MMLILQKSVFAMSFAVIGVHAYYLLAVHACLLLHLCSNVALKHTELITMWVFKGIPYNYTHDRNVHFIV